MCMLVVYYVLYVCVVYCLMFRRRPELCLFVVVSMHLFVLFSYDPVFIMLLLLVCVAEGLSFMLCCCLV